MHLELHFVKENRNAKRKELSSHLLRAKKHKSVKTTTAATDRVDNVFHYMARLFSFYSFQRGMARRQPNRKIEEMETSLTLFGRVNMRHTLPFYVVA